MLTVGHGPLDRGALRELLTDAGVQRLVDVRRFPGSRNNPDVTQGSMARWLAEAGIGYRWEEPLGGRRRLPAAVPEQDTWWTVPAFRAYAAHTRTAEFVAALDRVLDEVARHTVAVMCSESVWWRCHRRLIADVTALGRPDVRAAHHAGGPAEPAPGRRGRAGAPGWAGGLEDGHRPVADPRTRVTTASLVVRCDACLQPREVLVVSTDRGEVLGPRHRLDVGQHRPQTPEHPR